MLHPTKSFRLAKQVKRLMCTLVDPVRRSEFKASSIQAQLEAERKQPREKRGRSLEVEADAAVA